MLQHLLSKLASPLKEAGSCEPAESHAQSVEHVVGTAPSQPAETEGSDSQNQAQSNSETDEFMDCTVVQPGSQVVHPAILAAPHDPDLALRLVYTSSPSSMDLVVVSEKIATTGGRNAATVHLQVDPITQDDTESGAKPRSPPTVTFARGDVVWAEIESYREWTSKFHWPALVLAMSQKTIDPSVYTVLMLSIEGQTVCHESKKLSRFAAGGVCRPRPNAHSPYKYLWELVVPAERAAKQIVDDQRLKRNWSVELYLKDHAYVNLDGIHALPLEAGRPMVTIQPLPSVHITAGESRNALVSSHVRKTEDMNQPHPTASTSNNRRLIIEKEDSDDETISVRDNEIKEPPKNTSTNLPGSKKPTANKSKQPQPQPRRRQQQQTPGKAVKASGSKKTMVGLTRAEKSLSVSNRISGGAKVGNTPSANRRRPRGKTSVASKNVKPTAANPPNPSSRRSSPPTKAIRETEPSLSSSSSAEHDNSSTSEESQHERSHEHSPPDTRKISMWPQSQGFGDDEQLDYHDDVCSKCERGGDLLMCDGGCFRSWHYDCMEGDIPQLSEEEPFLCRECSKKRWKCFICHREEVPDEDGDMDTTLLPCAEIGCGKRYHWSCVSNLPHTQWSVPHIFKCPRHKCADCDHPLTCSKRTVARCTRCPIAYHTKCRPPGLKLLDEETHFVCARHLIPKKVTERPSRNWNECVVCLEPGDLVCCDGCPDAYHLDCLSDNMKKLVNNLKDVWFCSDCITGKYPIEGEIVWAKQSGSKYWPAKIWNLDNLPSCLQRDQSRADYDLPIRWYGDKEPYTWSWVPANFVGRIPRQTFRTKKNDEKFNEAVRQAEEDLEKNEAVDENAGYRDTRKPPPFTKITRNVFLSEKNVRKMDLDELQCGCGPKLNRSPCDGDSCENRAMMIECDKNICRWKDKCQNQRIQQRQYAKVEPFFTGNRGWGLRLLQNVAEDDLIIEYVGEVLDREMLQRRLQRSRVSGANNWYCLAISEDQFIDSREKGNVSRFINHSCSPNCRAEQWTVNGHPRVGIFADQDIKAGMELTYKYNFSSLDRADKSAFKCYCGSPNCTGYLGGNPGNKSDGGSKRKRDENTKKHDLRKKTGTARGTKQALRQQAVQGQNLDSKSNPPGVGTLPTSNAGPEEFDDEFADFHDDHCFLCGKLGDVTMCESPDCPKVYHSECLEQFGLPVPGPSDVFICAVHGCDNCDQAARYFCSRCTSSFCSAHVPSEMKNARRNALCSDCKKVISTK